MNKKVFGLSLLILLCICIGILQFIQTNKPQSISVVDQNVSVPVPSPSPTPEPTISLVFVGDIMLDRTIRLKAQQHGYDFLIGPNLKQLLSEADYGVANLEGPVTTNQSVSVGSEVGSTRNFIFTFAPESLPFLKKHNITVVNLGNNHILNFGQQGLTETYQNLDTSQLKYFGYTSTTQPENSSFYILEHNGSEIGFVNYNQFIIEGESQALIDIEKIKNEVDYLILYTHWGNEYVPENKVLVDLAHQFIDAGVDLIIGSHPHVVTGHEIYKDKHIYYSLGNFIFDQYFSDDVKTGLVVTALINPISKETFVTEQTVSLSPTGQTELVP